MKAAALVLAVGIALSSSSSAHADESSTDALVAEADTLARSGDQVAAAAKLERAFRESQRPDIAGKLGLLEQLNGDYAKSAQHLEQAMRFLPEKGSASDRQKLITAFTEVRSKVAAIRFRVRPDAERVKIDGASPSLTTLDYDVFVMPGTRHVSVPGRDDVIIEAVANQSYPIDVSEVKSPSSAPAHSVVVKTKRPLWPVVVGSILAAGGVGVGVGMTVVASEKSSDAKTIAKSSACAGDPSSACLASGYRATSDHNTFQAAGIAGFVGGGALLVSTLTYAFWPESQAHQEPVKEARATFPKLTFEPRVGKGSTALAVGGSF